MNWLSLVDLLLSFVNYTHEYLSKVAELIQSYSENFLANHIAFFLACDDGSGLKAAPLVDIDKVLEKGKVSQLNRIPVLARNCTTLNNLVLILVLQRIWSQMPEVIRNTDSKKQNSKDTL